MKRGGLDHVQWPPWPRPLILYPMTISIEFIRPTLTRPLRNRQHQPLTCNNQLHNRLTIYIALWPDITPCNGERVSHKDAPLEPAGKCALHSVWSPGKMLTSAVQAGRWLRRIDHWRWQQQWRWRCRWPSRGTGSPQDKNLLDHCGHVQESPSLQPGSGRSPLQQPNDHRTRYTPRPCWGHHQGALPCHQEARRGCIWTPNLQAFRYLP